MNGFVNEVGGVTRDAKSGEHVHAKLFPHPVLILNSLKDVFTVIWGVLRRFHAFLC